MSPSEESAPLIYSESTSKPTAANQRHVSFAPDALDNGAGTGTADQSRMSTMSQASTYSTASSSSSSANKKFFIHFHEHRLRFDQTYPEGLEGRISPDEYSAVLEKIHRDYAQALEESQKRVNKWSVICFASAPVAVGFILTPVLARYVHRHQKAFKKFWHAVRAHLKTLNKETYLVRGIEWRIERDLEKVENREAYNRWHTFRIELILRKPVVTKNTAERRNGKNSVQNQLSSRESQRQTRESMRMTDPELFAAAAFAGVDHDPTLISNSKRITEESIGDNRIPEESIGEKRIIEAVEPFDEENKTSPAILAGSIVAATAVDIASPQKQQEPELSTSPPTTKIAPLPKKSYAEMIAAVQALSTDEPAESVKQPAGLVVASIDDEDEPERRSAFAARQKKKLGRISPETLYSIVESDSGSFQHPLAAYSLVDPFAALYETEKTTPIYPPSPPSSSSSKDGIERYIEVDGESEVLRSKKYRVAPERASRLSKVYSMTETIHPASRRSSYLPTSRDNEFVRKTMA